MMERMRGYGMPFVGANPITTTYTFNGANQLTKVQGPGGTVTFTYDGDGLRLRGIPTRLEGAGTGA